MVRARAWVSVEKRKQKYKTGLNTNARAHYNGGNGLIISADIKSERVIMNKRECLQ